METIKSITKFDELIIKDNIKNNGKYSGYVVETDVRNIKILIEAFQSCCESWGYACSEDNTEEFVGKQLISASIVDVGLNTKMIDISKSVRLFGDTMFVNIETSAGTLQFAVYNEHNGYYGHDAIVMIGQEETKRSL